MRLAPGFLQTLFSTAPLALGLSVLACGVAVLTLHHSGDGYARPEVGEFVWYQPWSQLGEPPGPAVMVPATRLAGRGMQAQDTGEICSFDVKALLRGGGSLLVVMREAEGAMLHVRWTGGPTHATADCGSTSDLRMHRDAFLTLRDVADFGMPRLPEAIIP